MRDRIIALDGLTWKRKIKPISEMIALVIDLLGFFV